MRPSEKRNEEKAILKHLDSINLDEKVFQLEDEYDVKVIVLLSIYPQMFIFLVTKGLKKPNELIALARFFQDFSFFQNMIKTLPDKQYNSLIKKLKYEFIPKHTVVFYKGN
jgi:hypothetical protein